MILKAFSKKGQGTMEMPFQMIFSIILIAIFLYAAFTGISYFLERADQAKIGQFVVDFEAQVNKVWQTTEAEQKHSFDLPKGVVFVCFGDLSKSIPESICPDFELYKQQAVIAGSNMFLCPPQAAYSVGAPVHFKIDCQGNDCLSFEQATPYCVKASENEVSFTLRKEFENPKVILK